MVRKGSTVQIRKGAPTSSRVFELARDGVDPQTPPRCCARRDSSAGQSARLIIVRSRVRSPLPLHRSSATFALAARSSMKEDTNMASDKRIKVTLACEDCKRRNYITKKNKNNDRERIEMKKYCRFDRRHTVHKETR